MANVVLYRKYRPQTFAEVVGQEHVVQTLTNAISSEGLPAQPATQAQAGLLSHAYLFAGPRGSGKTSLARLLAKSLNCQGRKNREPCNKCSSCLEINQGNAIDLVEIDAASNRGIDEIRELRDGIKFAPTKSKYRVFIIDEAHQLTKEAANALLKTLEEPPSHAIFVLATTEIHKMIPTIISRCQRFDFRKLTASEIVKQLENISQKEGVKAEKAALELIAVNSQGAARDAIGMLDQAITFCTGAKDKEITVQEIRDLLGLVEAKVVSQFVEHLKKKDAKGAINYLNAIYEKGTDLEVFAKALTNHLRDILVFHITQESDVGFGAQELQRMLKIFLQVQSQMKYATIPQLPLELAIVEFLNPEQK
ncbi:MAG: DNA polymerase III subunit gamma/tau [Parcubacteria group bacterium Gr01-1014_30]|nr:MAG: DNA polymerase III subunit gamma/tau [Parcubacteria group bacterium Gr01-1014_30]